MSQIHTAGAITVCKLVKGDSDNKWNENIILIISGHKAVTVTLESVIVNGVNYHARITYYRDNQDLSKWHRDGENTFVHRNDQPRKKPIPADKDVIYILTDKIMEESHNAFPNLFMMADKTYYLDQVNINTAKAIELEKQAAGLRGFSKTLEHNLMERNKFYNQIIADRNAAKT